MSSSYICTGCGKKIKSGEFMAIIGEIPPTQLSTASDWVERLVDSHIGNIYCSSCVLSTDSETKTPDLPLKD